MGEVEQQPPGERGSHPGVRPDPFPSGVYSTVPYPEGPYPPPAPTAAAPPGVTTGDTEGSTDNVPPIRQIPTWALVATMVGFFVVGPFSLLFLLVRESRPAR